MVEGFLLSSLHDWLKIRDIWLALDKTCKRWVKCIVTKMNLYFLICRMNLYLLQIWIYKLENYYPHAYAISIPNTTACNNWILSSNLLITQSKINLSVIYHFCLCQRWFPWVRMKLFYTSVFSVCCLLPKRPWKTE